MRLLEHRGSRASGRRSLTRETGNGAPSGAHYTLNIIGVSKDKTAEMDGNNGSRIFVPLWDKAKINLTEGDFGVLDANGTDADGATFSLPDPDPDADGVTEYSVYARVLGTPGGSSTTTMCATDPDTDEEICSTEAMVLIRDRGKSYFDNVSRELLYIYYDLDGDGTPELIPLFDERLEDYFLGLRQQGSEARTAALLRDLHRRQLTFVRDSGLLPDAAGGLLLGAAGDEGPFRRTEPMREAPVVPKRYDGGLFLGLCR